jgi:hypothetical protein
MDNEHVAVDELGPKTFARSHWNSPSLNQLFIWCSIGQIIKLGLASITATGVAC